MKIKVLMAVAILAAVMSVPACKGKPASQPNVFTSPGSKCRISDSAYIVYDFDHKPALGMSILKIELFGSDGTRITDWTLKGVSGMPSMNGMHDSSETLFRQNKKGDYLLPVNVVMPGGWEVRVKAEKGGAESAFTIQFSL